MRPLQSGKCLLVESVILGFGIRNTTRGIRNPLTIGIHIPSSTYKESAIHNLECGIHVMKSRIEDCLVFPFMGRLFRPRSHVFGYFEIRNFSFRIQKFPRPRVSGFKSNLPVYTYPERIRIHCSTQDSSRNIRKRACAEVAILNTGLEINARKLAKCER